MSNGATITRRTMDREPFEYEDELEEYLESLSAPELRELASYIRKKAIGKEDPSRKPGSEGARWLVAEYSRGSGPYFYLKAYRSGDRTYTDKRGHMQSGKRTTKYIGRHLPADLAEEFGYPEGTTPEETNLTIRGTSRHGSSRKN